MRGLKRPTPQPYKLAPFRNRSSYVSRPKANLTPPYCNCRGCSSGGPKAVQTDRDRRSCPYAGRHIRKRHHLITQYDGYVEGAIDMQVAILRLGIGYLVGSILGGGVGGAGSELQKLYVRGSPACYGRGCRADTIPHPACFLDIWCVLGVCYDTLKIGECV